MSDVNEETVRFRQASMRELLLLAAERIGELDDALSRAWTEADMEAGDKRPRHNAADRALRTELTDRADSQPREFPCIRGGPCGGGDF